MGDSIIVTDLTQMGGNRICIAGYLDEEVCVRPIFETGGLTKGWLYKDNQVIIQPFSIVEFDFDSCAKITPKKPHTEDRILRSSYCTNHGMLTSDEKRSFLAEIDDRYVNDIFGAEIFSGPGWFIKAGEGERSLGTISRPNILEVFYGPGETKFDYRISFADRSDARYRLAVTDLSFRYFLDYLYFRKMMDAKDASEFVAEKLRKAEMIFIRIGLARGDWEKYPDRCYLQINGIYSFPDYLNERIFADFELADRELAKRSTANMRVNPQEPMASNSFNAITPEVVRTTNEQVCHYSENLAKIKAAYPRAYEYWSEDEDNRLIQLARLGQNVPEIADQLQRQPGAIRSRIKKLDINYEMINGGGVIVNQIQKLNNANNNENFLENAFTIHLQILKLQKQILNLKREYETCIETAKTLRISEQGLYELKLITKKTRKVDVTLFGKLYPEIFLKLASIPVLAAEKEIGRDAMDKVVKYVERESFKVTKKEKSS